MSTFTAIGLAQTSTRPGAAGVAAAERTIARDRTTLRFFQTHGWLLADPRFAPEARRQVALHRRSLAAARRTLAARRRALAARARAARQRHVVRLLAARDLPAAAICRVFGASYCADAIRVARCESGLRIDARNGQYLGLFQMGATERRLFGHGPSAAEQARAAQRYFVASGRDWSPWSCKP